MPADPSLLVIGHGSRDPNGVAEYWSFVDHVSRRADMPVGGGFIELAEPDLDTAVDKLVADGAEHVVAVPLVLLGAGHMKLDGPAALERARSRHPDVRFDYGRALGIHPLVLAVAADRVPRGCDGVVLVGRGSSDPDANADLYKVARLVQDATGVTARVRNGAGPVATRACPRPSSGAGAWVPIGSPPFRISSSRVFSSSASAPKPGPPVPSPTPISASTTASSTSFSSATERRSAARPA